MIECLVSFGSSYPRILGEQEGIENHYHVNGSAVTATKIVRSWFRIHDIVVNNRLFSVTDLCV